MITNNFDYKEPSHHIDLALNLAKALKVLGYDGCEIFKANGLDLSEPLTSNQRIGIGTLQTLWRESVAATGKDQLGIVCAQNLNPIGMHGLWVCAAANDTMLDAFICLIRYFRVIATLGRLDLIKREQELRLSFNLPMPAGIAAYESVDSVMAGLVRFSRFASNKAVSAIRIELQRPEPQALSAFENYFRCPIIFNAKQDALIFNSHDMDKPLSAVNPDVARANEQVVVDYLRRFDEIHLANRVTSIIIEELPEGIPTSSRVAELMATSVRTLRRKLAAEGVTFLELLEQTQQVLACNYLIDTTMSIGEISQLVGYSEPSNFTRSFKKWTKRTPNEFRLRYGHNCVLTIDKVVSITEPTKLNQA